METKKSLFLIRLEEINKLFNEKYGYRPDDIFSSPGRIEIIGNHLDHNHGSVMVGSIDLSIIAVTSKNNEGTVYYGTSNFPSMEIKCNDLEKKEKEIGSSFALIRGILSRFVQKGYNIGGVDIFADTNIFKGAGVSSSAAFELLICQILNYYYNDNEIPAIELAKIAQYSESIYFGKPCGLLDQAGIALGGINYIDFYNIENPKCKKIYYTFENYSFVLVNTKDSHSKLTVKYSEILDDMKSVSNYFGKEYLIDVNENEFIKEEKNIKEQFGERAFNRSLHFFNENKRVKEAAKALYRKDEDSFAKLIGDSGYSSYYYLKNCYVNSEEENLPKGINYSKEILKNGYVRVHGGGFAGTLISIVKNDEVQNYIKAMRKIYGFANVRKINVTRFGTRHVGKLNDYLGEEYE